MIKKILSTKKWIKFNDLLLKLENNNNPEKYCQILLNNLSDLFPYNFANVFFYNQDNDNKIITPSLKNISQQTLDDYINHYQFIDNIKNKFFKQIQPSKSTNLVDYEKLKKTEYFQNFLKPNNYYYLCGTDIFYSKNIIASLSLIREKKQQDFKEEDLLILKYLAPHLGNHLYRLISKNNNLKWTNQFNLTKREIEVINLVLQGLENKEIAKQLIISINTVKKHLNKVYQKCNVKNRVELITNLLNNNYPQ